MHSTGRVCVITGAGRGIGRHHALLFAHEGASVVVNDNGSAPDGTGHDPAVAQAVADEIVAAGGAAVASDADIATMAGAQSAFDLAMSAFGDCNVVVNNAGVLRDKMFVNMTEDDWDAVIRGHLKTTFCMSRVAMGAWRDESKAGKAIAKRDHQHVVDVGGSSALRARPTYGAAKAAIASLTMILAMEAKRIGVRVNCVVPAGRTRMTEDSPRHEGPREEARGRLLRRVRAPPRLTGRRLPRDRRLPAHRAGVHGQGRRHPPRSSRGSACPGSASPRDFSVADVAEFMQHVPDVPVSP